MNKTIAQNTDDEDLKSRSEKIVFKRDAKQICNQLDVLFSIVSKLEITDSDITSTEIKIRSGIMRLKKLNAFDEAAFYETEIVKLSKGSTSKQKIELYTVLFCLLGLALLSWFSTDILEHFFSFVKKIFK